LSGLASLYFPNKRVPPGAGQQLARKLIGELCLSQTEISRDEKHHHDKTDDVNYIVHVYSSFLFILVILAANGDAGENTPSHRRRVKATQ
jgi:hypothetical protein